MDGIVDLGVEMRCDADLPMRKFALRVVSELAQVSTRRSALPNPASPNPALMALVRRFALRGDPALLSEVFGEMARCHLLAEDILDVYLPQTIKEIGAEWHDDQIDILQASMAFARLQRLLRELGKAWVSDQSGRVSGGRILLLLPRCEQHTLGAMFAANQLRRSGVSVKVMLAPVERQIATVFERTHFHGIFISISNVTSLGACTELVRNLRASAARQTPIVVGGAWFRPGLQICILSESPNRRAQTS